MEVPAKTKVSSFALSAIAEIIGDEMFSSTKALTQMKLLLTVSNKPEIAYVPIGAPGNEVYVAEVILTYPPL